MVPVAGLEPARYRYRWILSPLRLPIPSHRQNSALLLYANVIPLSNVFWYKAESGALFQTACSCELIFCITRKPKHIQAESQLNMYSDFAAFIRSIRFRQRQSDARNCHTVWLRHVCFYSRLVSFRVVYNHISPETLRFRSQKTNKGRL